ARQRTSWLAQHDLAARTEDTFAAAIKIDDQVPASGLRLRIAVKGAETGARQHNVMIEPLVGGMREPRLGSNASDRFARGVAHADIESGVAGRVTRDMAFDPPMQ